jgi:shikimate dehydrogenase
VPATVFRAGALAYELAYGKGLTPFLQLAQGSGVQQLADGVGMLVEQAAEAFAWWHELRPETRPVIEQLTVPLK